MSAAVTSMPHKPKAMSLTPIELNIHLDWHPGEDNPAGEHDVMLPETSDLGLALQALSDEGGTDETGTVLVRLGVDGEGYDRVLVDCRGEQRMEEVLGQARESIEYALDALKRLRSA